MSDANSSSANAVAISQRTMGVSFDLPSLEWNGPQIVDLKAASDHITDNLPKLALSTKRPSFDWLGNGPAAPSLSSTYPRLENTPQYLQCRRTLNDLASDARPGTARLLCRLPTQSPCHGRFRDLHWKHVLSI